ncbi:MAG: GumC family protein [bacterium]
MQNQDIGKLIFQAVSILRRRKWYILLSMIGVLIPVIIYNLTVTPVYQASAALIFEDVSNPLTNKSYDPLRRYYRETSILNRIQEIKSRSLAAEIVTALPDDMISRIKLPRKREANFDKKQFITNRVQESISADVVRKTDVIEIQVETSDPRLSVAIANTAASVLRERNLKNKKDEVSGLRQFIEEQLALYKEKLHSADQSLRYFKEKSRVTSLEQESGEILRRITDAEVKYNQVKARRQSTEERLAVIRDKLSQNKKKLVPTITDISSPSLQKLKEKLVQLQVQYTNLQVQDYPADHPKMMELSNAIEQTKKTLTGEALKLTQGEIVVDPLSQIKSYLTQSVSLEIELETLKAQEKALQKVVNGYDESLKKLPGKEYQLANFMRNRNVNEKIYMMLSEKYEEARITEAEKIPNLRIIDQAQLPEAPLKPRKRLNLAIGVMVGLLTGFGLALFVESIDTTIKSSEDVENLTGWPVLTSIPRFTIPRNDKNGAMELPVNGSLNGKSNGAALGTGVISSHQHLAPTSEAYRILRTNMQVQKNNKNLRTILLTSLRAQEGKSTTVANLGISFARLGLKVLIIDSDLRRPTMHTIFGLDKEPGLSDILTYNFDLLEKFSTTTEIENLQVLCSGTIAPNPSELLSTSSIKYLIQELKNKFDLILIDSPPLLPVPETLVLSEFVDGVLMVIESHKVEQELILKAQKLLEKTNSNVIGAVLNRLDPKLTYKAKDYLYYA